MLFKFVKSSPKGTVFTLPQLGLLAGGNYNKLIKECIDRKLVAFHQPGKKGPGGHAATYIVL